MFRFALICLRGLLVARPLPAQIPSAEYAARRDTGGYSCSPTGMFQLNEVFTIEPDIDISTALLDMLADTPKNRAFIARVRPVVERCNHIGIRIEDDYLVTPTGVEWLSKAPRDIREFGAVMQATAKSRRGGS